MRIGSRGLGGPAVHAAMTWGRVIHTRGAEFRVIGRRQIAEVAKHGVDLREFEGVQVVCSPGGTDVITVYRNRDFRSLRPRRRRKSTN